MLLSIAAIAVTGYFLLNAAGLFVLGGRTKGVEIIYFIAPVLVLPCFLAGLRSLHLASALLWIDFALVHLSYIAIDWPHYQTSITAFRSDWPLLLIALLMQLAASETPQSTTTRSQTLIWRIQKHCSSSLC